MHIVPFDLIVMRKFFDIAKGHVVMFRRTPAFSDSYINKLLINFIKSPRDVKKMYVLFILLHWLEVLRLAQMRNSR